MPETLTYVPGGRTVLSIVGSYTNQNNSVTYEPDLYSLPNGHATASEQGIITQYSVFQQEYFELLFTSHVTFDLGLDLMF